MAVTVYVVAPAVVPFKIVSAGWLARPFSMTQSTHASITSSSASLRICAYSYGRSLCLTSSESDVMTPRAVSGS